MANNETKTNAEIYREQRKARLAKAAKKKKHGKNDKVIGILVKVVCILLVAALVLYFIGTMLTNVFCLPQKVLTAATYGDYKITVAEYNYFYMSLYNSAANTASQYESYYSGMGAQYFDTTVDPADQTCQEADLPEGVVTWADYFAYCAPERAFLVFSIYDKAMSDEAKAAGFAVSAEEQTSMTTAIDSVIKSYQDQATASDYALDNFLSKTFGEGVTEKLYRELLEKEYVAELYLTWYQENVAENVDQAKLDAYYLEHKSEIDVISMRTFGISYAEPEEGSEDPSYTKEQAKARADQFVAKLAEGADFVETAVEFAPPSHAEDYKEESATLMKYQTKTSLDQISEDLGTWAFAAERAVNDTYIVEIPDSEAYFVVMLTATASKNTTPTSVDVRHILVEVKTTTTSDSGEDVDLPAETIELNKTNAKAEAEALVKKWEENGKTEQAFIDLVANNTDDSGSASTGGLYEGINSDSSYVTEFLDWSLAAHEAGDVEIIETVYGYHVMYYVGGDTTERWESDIRNTIATDAYTDFYMGIADQVRASTVRKEAVCNYFTKRTEELLADIIANNASSSSYSYY